jgi:hypothetical protein
LRPYFQEGFLAGTADVTFDFDAKTELDFRNRLIAKFVIARTKKFWGDGFEPLPRTALYPAGDAIDELCQGLREELRSETVPGDLGEFVENWAALEQYILEEARRLSERNVSVREAISILRRHGMFTDNLAGELDALRRLRNAIVHTPERIPSTDIGTATGTVRRIFHTLTGNVA